MVTRTARINCNGEVFDDDSGDIFGGHEKEAYDWSSSIRLEQGGTSYSWIQSKTVDGEVTFKVEATFVCESSGKIVVHGIMILIEGGGYDTSESRAIDTIVIEPDQTRAIYNGRIDHPKKDWASIKFEVSNVS